MIKLNTSNLCLIMPTFFFINPRSIRIAKALSKKGYVIDVICFNDRSSKEENYVEIKNVTVHSINIERKKNGKFRYFFEYLIFSFLSFLKFSKLFMKRRYNIVHVNNPPDTLVFVTLFHKIFFNIKVILDISEPLSKSFSKKFSKESSFFLAMLDKIQLLASKYSDCIITVSIAFKRELLRIGISEKKIHILANSPDDTFFKPELEHTTKQDIGFENRFIVLYQGSVSKERGIDRLIDAVNLLKVKIPNILGLIAGGGGQITELQCMIENLGLEKYIHLTGRLSPNEIPKFVACADVCTLMALDIPVYRLYSPDKLFEYMTYKKIILAPKLDGIIDITGIDGCYYYKAGDADDMAKQIYKIYQENNHTEHIRRSQEIFQNYKWETAKLEMLKCYNKLKK